MPPPIPRCSSGAYSSLNSPSHFSLPQYGSRVGLHIVLFEACSAFTRVAACTLALSPIRDTLIEGFSHFVTSMTAPIASGWSGCRVGLAPTGKRRLCTAHANSGHSSAGYPHAVGVNRSDMFHVATSSSRREAVASCRVASRFERTRLQCRAPLDDGVIEQFEHQTKGRQFLFLDGAVIVTFERFAYDGVDLALHRQQFLVGFRGAYAGNHGQDSVAMAGVFAPFISIQIVTQPGAGRTDPGEKQERKPEVIALPVEEGAFGAVDDSCRSPVYRQLRVVLG